MARKKSYGKKPAETMRQRQLRLIKEQQARKAAASKFVKASSSKPTSQRVEKVKVKVEPQKKLPAGKTQKALPPGKKGGPVSTGNRPRRRNVKTNPPSNTTRTATGSKTKPRAKPTKPTKPSLTNRIYVEARRLGINPTKVKELIAKNATLRRLSGAATAAAITEALLAAAPGPTGRRVRANQAERERKRKSVMDMAANKGRKVLEILGIVDKKPNQTASKPKPSPSKRGMPNIPPKEGTGKGSPNDKPQRSSRPSPQPTSRPSPQRSSRPTRSKTGANDPRNAAYIAARKKLNANSTKAERDKVRDMGIKLFKGMQGNKSKSQSKKPAASKSTPARKPTPKAATGADARSLRSGPTPPKPAKATKPAKKVYGSTGRKDLKQSARMAAALKDLKIRRYKNKE